MPRKKNSTPRKRKIGTGEITPKQRASDDALRRELENADPGVFEKLVKPLFRRTGETDQQRKSG